MSANWDTMSLREKVDSLQQSKSDNVRVQQLALAVDRMTQQLALGMDRLSIEIMACLAILGAMAERSAPEPARVRAWCVALRSAAPRISQSDLEESAKRIYQLLQPVMQGPAS